MLRALRPSKRKPPAYFTGDQGGRIRRSCHGCPGCDGNLAASPPTNQGFDRVRGCF